MLGSPVEIAALAGVALLLFGADRLPKLARSAGEAKREFLRAQLEADEEAKRARLAAESPEPKNDSPASH